jgi:hypothetical protein
MAWGNRDTKDNVILTGIDAALLENYRLRDGATYADVVVNMAEAMLGGFKCRAWQSDPFWSSAGFLHRPDGDALLYRQ